MVTFVDLFPKHLARPNLRSSINAALAGPEFICPLHGVYGLASRPPTWAQVAEARKPLHGMVLRFLSATRSNYMPDIHKKIVASFGFNHTTDEDVRVSLRWLKRVGLVFNNGHQWAKYTRADAPCQDAGTRGRVLLDHEEKQKMLKYMLS